MFHIYIIMVALAASRAKCLHGVQASELFVSNTAKLLRDRGYLAEDHNIDVQGGAATLNLIRATNPRINMGLGGLPGKDPVLFVHGFFNSVNFFIELFDGVRPKDYSAYNVSSMSAKRLARTLRNEPASKSLVFTALNFGHEVWLLNRRPTLESQAAYLLRHELGDNFNPFDIFDTVNLVAELLTDDYWDFSFEEQGRYDIPEVIDYILEQTGRRKLAYVGHSAGCLIPIITLSLRPEYADKISKAIFWAPAYYLRVMPFTIRQFLLGAIPVLAELSLPLLPQAVIPPLNGFLGIICKRLFKPFLCDPLLDLINGPGTDQQKNDNAALVGQQDDVSAKETAQLARAFTDGLILPFNRVADPEKMLADDQLYRYNISLIRLKTMSMWAGNTDNFVPIQALDQLIRDLSVPVDRHFINERGVLFNHFAFLLHDRVADLVVLPSYKIIASN